MACARQSYELNPHSMMAVTALSFIEIVWGEPESAIEHSLEALRLSPRPAKADHVPEPGDGERMCRPLRRRRRLRNARHSRSTGFALLHTHLAVNYVGLGELAKARAALDESTRIAPGQVERSLAGFMVR